MQFVSSPGPMETRRPLTTAAKSGWEILAHPTHVEVIMNSNKVNSMSHQFLQDWNSALTRLESPELRGRAVVLRSASPRTYCAGLNLIDMYNATKQDVAKFLVDFNAVLLRTVRHPAPFIAALNGHAIAGGVVLAACCDIVVAAEGNYRFGLAEVPDVGIPFPAVPLEIVRAKVPRQNFVDAAMFGQSYTPETAHKAGLIHRVVPAGDLLAAARREAERLAPESIPAFGAVKAEMWRPSLEKLTPEYVNELDTKWIASMVEGEGRARMAATLAKIGQPQTPKL